MPDGSDANYTGYVLVLVHGTFAPNAEWTDPTSVLCMTLKSQLGIENVIFHRFNWKGKSGSRNNNGHNYRIKAGEALASEMRQLQTSYPKAQHFIVSHSHGGNVALYALKDPAVRQVIGGVVCMGAPFIRCNPREYKSGAELNKTIGNFSGFAIGMGSWFGGALLLAPYIKRLFFANKINEAQSFGVGLLTVGIALLILISLGLNQMERIRKLVTDSRDRLIGQLSTPELGNIPMYCVRARGDEALAGLVAQQNIASLPSRLWNDKIYRSAGCLLTFFIILILCLSSMHAILTFVESSKLDDWWILTLFFIMVIGVLWKTRDTLLAIVMAIGYLVLAPFVLVHFISVILIPQIRSHTLGFGPENLICLLLTNTQAAALPEDWGSNAHHESKEYTLAGSGLIHSRYYKDQQVLLDIGNWISAR